jgi:hypothetical protein
VNGVSSTSETPYLKYLPSLATVWQFLAFDKARQFIICTFLAERCGERRSHRAYALRAMVHMMDMLMSAHGLVYSNVKWISLRWHKFRQAGPSEVIPSTLLGEVDALWEKVLPAYLGAAAPPFGNALLALFNKICEALALDADLKPQSAVELFQRKGSVLPFCGGSSVAFEPRGIITLFQTTDAQPPPLEWLNQLAELAPDHAGSLLRGSRARLVDFSLSSSPESAS